MKDKKQIKDRLLKLNEDLEACYNVEGIAVLEGKMKLLRWVLR